jgi:hypothetical protein
MAKATNMKIEDKRCASGQWPGCRCSVHVNKPKWGSMEKDWPVKKHYKNHADYEKPIVNVNVQHQAPKPKITITRTAKTNKHQEAPGHGGSKRAVYLRPRAPNTSISTPRSTWGLGLELETSALTHTHHRTTAVRKPNSRSHSQEANTTATVTGVYLHVHAELPS